MLALTGKAPREVPEKLGYLDVYSPWMYSSMSINIEVTHHAVNTR